MKKKNIVDRIHVSLVEVTFMLF